jgi:hypothetical protein
MADNVPITPGAGTSISTEEISTLNGAAVTPQQAQRILLALRTADGTALDVGAASPFPVKDAGTYGYAAGAAAATVDVPTGARIKRVSVIAGASVAATVTILGGATITIPAGGGFDEQLPGDAIATSGTSEVVIGGTAQAYYVGWVA